MLKDALEDEKMRPRCRNWQLFLTIKDTKSLRIRLIVSVACRDCCKFAVALYPDSTHSSKDKYLLPVIQSSLISIMMQTATLKSD